MNFIDKLTNKINNKFTKISNLCESILNGNSKIPVNINENKSYVCNNEIYNNRYKFYTNKDNFLGVNNAPKRGNIYNSSIVKKTGHINQPKK